MTTPSEPEPISVSVLRDRCAGTGVCAVVAPTVLDLDAGDLAYVLQPRPHGDDAAAARKAAEACPQAAIRLDPVPAR